MALMLILGSLVVVLVVLLIKQHRKTRPMRLPPLVPGIPFVGSILGFDRRQPHISLTKWSMDYGDIFRIRLLGNDIVVVSGQLLIKQVFGNSNNTEFAGRPSNFRIDYGFHGSKDIIFGGPSSKWERMKKIASAGLKRFGSGRSKTEMIVQVEMQQMVESLMEQEGKDCDPSIITRTAVVNAIAASVMGKRFARNDPQMNQYKLITRLFSESCSPVDGMELDLFPWLRFLPNKCFSKLTKSRNMLHKWIDKELEDVKVRHNSEDCACVLDLLLETQARDQGQELALTDEDIRCIFIDILISGTLTTAIALDAFILLMAHHPTEQDQLHAEIDLHLGSHQLPNSAVKLNRLEAAILEVLRYISHVPLCLPHLSTCDAKIDDFDIPKNTQILLNLWALHHDEHLWGDPWNFRPGRFLDHQGELITPGSETRSSLLLFGAGKRMCMGASLARERLFLYAACILQNFDIRPPENTPLTSCDPRYFNLGLILEPKPFHVKLSNRIQSTEFC